jgi:catechol 2,3-dioxygenase-like lactoylglutathione lyase family enzyme
MELFLVELTVADWAASLAWYRDRLGLTVELLDEPNRYAMLSAGRARVALKVGRPTPGGTTLTFLVAELDSELDRLNRAGIIPTRPPRMSAEGYRSARFADPDGHPIELFEWVGCPRRPQVAT